MHRVAQRASGEAGSLDIGLRRPAMGALHDGWSMVEQGRHHAIQASRPQNLPYGVTANRIAINNVVPFSCQTGFRLRCAP